MRMTIEKFIPKIDDIYTDEKGFLHTDINLPVSDENNYVLKCITATKKGL